MSKSLVRLSRMATMWILAIPELQAVATQAFYHLYYLRLGICFYDNTHYWARKSCRHRRRYVGIYNCICCIVPSIP
ncbi:hypothetical protein F4861DRAFT_522383 [Xylaria intraflava]|nr:hypothetical protein F4861DRAFT_522383 [Xylaria intraflava]